MDFITANGILGCIALLWICNLLMLRLIYRLQERVEDLRTKEHRCWNCKYRIKCDMFRNQNIYLCGYY